MPLVDEIQKDMHKAMKEKEKERINALRNIIGKLKYKYIDKGDKLTEQEEIKVIQSLAKQRRESIEMYKQGGRNDLVETETKELSIIEEYSTNKSEIFFAYGYTFLTFLSNLVYLFLDFLLFPKTLTSSIGIDSFSK